MTYASLWSLSYFTFTLKQLLKPDTREYVYTKIWALHRYSFWCRSADFEICLWVIIALQIAQSYFVSATKSCTYSQLSERVLVPGLVGWPWFRHGNHAFEEWHHGWPWSTEAHLTMVTMADHGQPWYIWPWSKWYFWPCQHHFIDHGQPWFVKWHLSQPWLTMLQPSFYHPWSTMVCEMAPQSTMVAHALAKLSTNHGWPCSGQAFINHGWPCYGQTFINHGQPWFVKWHLSHPWLTMLWLSFNHAFIPRLNWGAISQTMVEPWLKAWFNYGSTMVQPCFFRLDY